MLDDLRIAVMRALRGLRLDVLKPLCHKLRDLRLAWFHERASSQLMDHLGKFGFSGLTITVNALPMLVTLTVFIPTEIDRDVIHISGNRFDVTFHCSAFLSFE
jgi:hypothetical protein